jgi:hypothetical protein
MIRLKHVPSEGIRPQRKRGGRRLHPDREPALVEIEQVGIPGGQYRRQDSYDDQPEDDQRTDRTQRLAPREPPRFGADASQS